MAAHSSSFLLSRGLFLLLAAAIFTSSPLIGGLGVLPASAVQIVLGIALALAASGTLSAVAVAGGSLGMLACGLLGGISSVAATAVLLPLCFAERTLRVRSPGARVLHLTLAVAAGAGAGLLTSSFAASDLGIRAVVIIMAAVLAALPLFVAADDPLAHALDAVAGRIESPVAKALRQGAELRRTVDSALLEPPVAREVNATWRSLLRLAQARVKLPPHSGRLGARSSAQLALVISRLDERIVSHVAALTRTFTAADAAEAAVVSLDDHALRSVESSGQTLEQLSEAMVTDLGSWSAAEAPVPAEDTAPQPEPELELELDLDGTSAAG